MSRDKRPVAGRTIVVNGKYLDFTRQKLFDAVRSTFGF